MHPDIPMFPCSHPDVPVTSGCPPAVTQPPHLSPLFITRHPHVSPYTYPSVPMRVSPI